MSVSPEAIPSGWVCIAMWKGKRVAIVLPAYNAAKTLETVYRKLPAGSYDELFLVDDASRDNTFEVATALGIEAYRNPTNLGYGGNVKACIIKALEKGADIIIEMHPDNEYDTGAIIPSIEAVNAGADMVLGNRFTDVTVAVKSGMRPWKYVGSVILTGLQRWILGAKIKDLHQGFRVYTAKLLEKANYPANSDGYLFSFEIIAQAYFHRMKVVEVPVGVHYTGSKRGASFKHSLIYSLETFKTLGLFVLCRMGTKHPVFTAKPPSIECIARDGSYPETRRS